MIDSKAAIDLEQSGYSIPVAAGTAWLFNILALVAATVAILLPVVVVLYWVLVDLQEVSRSSGIASEALGAFGLVQRLDAGVITAVTVLPFCWGLMRLRACFSEFAQGRPFAARGIAGLRDFAIGMGLTVIAKAIGFTLLTLLLTWNAPPGMRQLAIQVNSDMLIMALFAATIAALTWAMGKAAIVAEENSQFV